MIYEHRSRPPITRRAFARRMARHAALALVLTLLSLCLGMSGYMYYEDLLWRDAFANAAMLLGGMGPIDAPKTPGGKIFAGVYALLRAVFLRSAGGAPPVLHRIPTLSLEGSRIAGRRTKRLR